jgi:REP element-mobilizing transposase RayT
VLGFVIHRSNKLPPSRQEVTLMGVWNDTDIPLAHLITFRSYGTWLHGDERGSVDRFRNIYGTPRIPPDKHWQQHNLRTLKAEPVILNAAQRQSVETAIRDTCEKRKWLLRALNVRTNHAHVVVSIGETKSELALNAFKANATRQMRTDGCWSRASSARGLIKEAGESFGTSAALNERSIM